MGSFYSTSKHFTATKTNIVVTRDRMQTVNILIVVTLSLSCLASPAPQPQEVADSSEVELIPPFDSGDGDGEEAGKPVVVVVRPTSFGDVFAGFPGFGRFPGFNSFPRLGDNHPHISLDEIFGGDQEESLTPASGSNCGLLCKVFKTLEGHLGVFEDDEGVKSKVFNNDEDPEKYDNHTQTYSEKVLADGSVLKINKTVIHDTDENGNGFFFSSSVHHIFQDNREEEDEEIAGDVVVNDGEEPDMDKVDEAIDETIVDIIDDPNKLTVLDTIEDPSINEI